MTIVLHCCFNKERIKPHIFTFTGFPQLVKAQRRLHYQQVFISITKLVDDLREMVETRLIRLSGKWSQELVEQLLFGTKMYNPNDKILLRGQVCRCG